MSGCSNPTSNKRPAATQQAPHQRSSRVGDVAPVIAGPRWSPAGRGVLVTMPLHGVCPALRMPVAGRTTCRVRPQQRPARRGARQPVPGHPAPASTRCAPHGLHGRLIDHQTSREPEDLTLQGVQAVSSPSRCAGPGQRANWLIIRTVTVGANSAPPSTTVRAASARSAAQTSLSMNRGPGAEGVEHILVGS
jgi:hypothetical protein